MNPVQEVLHFVNLFLFALCIPAYGRCLYELYRCDKPLPVRTVGSFLCISAMALSLMFLALQTSWNGIGVYREAVPVHASWYWMLYDYLISCYMLCVAAVVKVYCRWQRRLRNTVSPYHQPPRRWSDVGP